MPRRLGHSPVVSLAYIKLPLRANMIMNCMYVFRGRANSHIYSTMLVFTYSRTFWVYSPFVAASNQNEIWVHVRFEESKIQVQLNISPRDGCCSFLAEAIIPERRKSCVHIFPHYRYFQGNKLTGAYWNMALGKYATKEADTWVSDISPPLINRSNSGILRPLEWFRFIN